MWGLLRGIFYSIMRFTGFGVICVIVIGRFIFIEEFCILGIGIVISFLDGFNVC